MVPQEQPVKMRGRWILLPLRLFLGITFIYAGIQKLTDPQFFQPDAAGYIGKQLATYAQSSPLHGFLIQTAVPHATLFGLLVAYGEIAIGLGTLCGLLFRPATFFGLCLSLIFFLSISWRVYPYFYGADIVFAFCWLTLLLNGPFNSGLPTLDEFFYRQMPRRSPPYDQLLQFLLGWPGAAGTNASTQPLPGRQTFYAPQKLDAEQAARRHFISGALTGITSTLILAGLVYSWSLMAQRASGNTTAPSSSVDDAPPTQLPNTNGPDSVGTGTSTSGVSTVIAHVDTVPKNSAIIFPLPATGDNGVLVHLNDDHFVAFDATCTHAGCQVDYDSGSHLLVCPCHGAEYDPAQQAQVVNPPAPRPLAPVTIHIDSATGAITLASA